MEVSGGGARVEAEDFGVLAAEEDEAVDWVFGGRWGPISERPGNDPIAR